MAYTTIDDPSQYFQTALWSGDNATTQDITNDGNSDLQPDWVWVKCRNTGGNGFDHTVWDTSRGVDNNINKSLAPSQTDYEGLGDNVTTTAQLGGVSAMLSDGFTVREGSIDNDSRYVNESSRTYVGWQWKANGGTTASNTDGSITSTVQANTTAGFSIVTYTGTATGGATIGHGLGVAPKVVFTKTRAISDNWLVYHAGIGATKYLTLNTNSSESTSSGAWNDTAPSSTVVTLGSFDNSNDNDSMVAYCFAEKQGYSKFGSYTGNGNADGVFVHTGFKPAWFMLKRTDSANDWIMFDNKRDAYQNPFADYLFANLSDAENADTARGDFLSNGVKIRSSANAFNASSGTYIYMAFAKHPFVSSEGVPVTAK